MSFDRTPPAARRRPATPPRPRTGRGPSRPNLKADDFAALCELVRSLCGVDLGQYKRNQMERRVRTWSERRGTPDLAEYGKLLRKDPAELDAFLDRVTINVSHLWRHEDQFEVLRTKILPELTAERRRLKIWSAGSSYGAEAYTIAAVCRETIPSIPVEINGTDLDKRMVARAREGVFTAEDARTSPKAMMQRHFEPQPDGGWVAKPELKRMVRFENGDLLRMPVPKRPLRRGLLPQHRDLLHGGGSRRAARAARPVARARRLPRRRNIRACRRPARDGANLALPLHLPEELMDEYLPDVPGRGARAPAGAQPRGRQDRGEARTTRRRSTRSSASRTRMKGMSATMGFAGMAALTHEMEDVFELLRQRTRRARARRHRRASSSCLDALSAAVEAIDETGQEAIEPQALIERLRGARARAHAEQEAQRAGAAPRAGQPRPSWPTAAAWSRSPRSCDEDVSMPAVRAYMVLSVDRRARRDARLRPVARTTSTPSTAVRSTRGSSPSTPTPSWPTPRLACPRSPR